MSSMEMLNQNFNKDLLKALAYFDRMLTPEAAETVLKKEDISTVLRVFDFKTTLEGLITKYIKDIRNLPSLTLEQVSEKRKQNNKFYSPPNNPAIKELCLTDICWKPYDNYHIRYFLTKEEDEWKFWVCLSRSIKDSDKKIKPYYMENIDKTVYSPIIIKLSVMKEKEGEIYISSKHYFYEGSTYNVDKLMMDCYEKNFS